MIKGIDLEEKTEHVARIKDDDGNILAEFYGSPISPTRANKLLKDYTKYEWDAPKKRMEKTRFEKIDIAGLTKARIKETITGWDGITLKGKELPFTDENLMWLYENHTWLVNDAMEQFDAIGRGEQKLKEEEEKNSLTSQSGMPEETD